MGLLQPQPVAPSCGQGMSFCTVSPHGRLDPGRTLPPLPGHGTTTPGFGTAALGTCERVKYVSARPRLEDAWVDRAVNTQSIAVLQGGSPALDGVKAPWASAVGPSFAGELVSDD